MSDSRKFRGVSREPQFAYSVSAGGPVSPDPVEAPAAAAPRRGVYAVAVSAAQPEPEVAKEKASGGKKAAVAAGDYLSQGIALHDRAVQGDKGATKEAYALLRKAHEADPADPVAEAYFGSATALCGRDAVDPNERFSQAMRGLKILDRAVQKAPDNVKVRTLRAYVCHRLPETYFHRSRTAVEDFTKLITMYEEGSGAFGEGFYRQALFDLGGAYRNLGREGEAQKTWDKLLSVTNDPKYVQLVKEAREEERPFDRAAAPKLGGKPAAAAQAGKPDLAEGIRLHDLALKGDAQSAKEALDVLDPLVAKYPGDPLVAAYRASAYSLTGKYAPDPSAMFERAIAAMKELDRAVNQDPDNVRVRLLRANHSLRLPEPFFRRTSTAIADLEYLVDMAGQRPGALPGPTVLRCLHDLACCYERLGMEDEARTAWSRLLAANPPAELREVAQTGLQRTTVAAAAPPVPGNDPAQLLQEGTRLHDRGVAGDKEAARRAHALLAKAHSLDPKNALITAYYGSSVALLGRDSGDPSEMFSKAIQGFMLLKQAASQDMNDPRIRLLRGYLCLALPESFFHLSPRAKKDLNFVRTAYEQGNRMISEETYRRVMTDLAELLDRTGEPERAARIRKRLSEVKTK